jgi:hypothetical protein
MRRHNSGTGQSRSSSSSPSRPGLDTIPGCQHVGQVGAHAPVDPQRPPHPGLHPSRHGEVGVGPDSDHDQDQVGGDGEVGFAGYGEPAGFLVDGLDGDVVDDLDLVAAQLLAQQLAQLGGRRSA